MTFRTTEIRGRVAETHRNAKKGTAMKLGLIGCGNMGGGMGMQLLENGCDLICFDPDPGNLAKMAAAGAGVANAAVDLAAKCDVIILSLPTAAIVRAVMAEMSGGLRLGMMILDTSTSEPQTSEDLFDQGQVQGFHFVDGPVSGGPIAARAGTMTMLLGGDQAVIAQLRPVLDILTAKTVHVGGAGAGHAAKIVNNMLCAANLVLVAEAVRLGEAAGVNAKALLDGVNAGSGRSAVSEVNYPKWVLNGAFDSGFTMGLMRKDVGLARDLAKTSGITMNGFDAIAKIWAASAETLPDSADFNQITTIKNAGEK